jgi:hypothetical protein
MIRHFRTVILSFIFAISQLPFSIAQNKPAPAPAAPIPAQILAAKKVFIANAGGDQMTENDPQFTGGPDRAYNQFYAAMKTWGRFDLVNSPAEADLLLEIRQEVGVSASSRGSAFAPRFELTIRDPKSNALLWGFNIQSEFGLGQGNSDHIFDQVVERLATEFRLLVSQPQPATTSGNAP